MVGRVDVTRYANGVKKLRNFIALPQGGVERRPGTRYRGTAQMSGRLQEFIFSVKQSYVLEFTPGRVRFYRAGAQILNPDTSVYEVSTPYTAEDIDQLYFAQSADVLFITHPKYQTRTLSRRGETDWVLSLWETRDGPYSDRTINDVELTITGLVDVAELEASVATFVSGDVNKFVQFQEDDQWRLGKIKDFISSTRVTIHYMTNVMLGVDQSDLIAASGPVTPAFGRVSPAAKLTFATGTITSTLSGVFTTNDIGKVIRVFAAAPTASTSGYLWYLATEFTSTTAMKATLISSYLDYNVNTVRLKLSNRVTTAALVASQSTFVPTDVNRQFRLNYNSAITWGVIREVSNATVCQVLLKESAPLDQDQRDNSSDPLAVQLSNNGTTNNWKLGAWSETTGWPSCATFHQGRLWFARTDSQPQSLWGSQSDDYDNMATTELDSTVLDTSSIDITLASNQANEIVWLSSGKVMLVGTISSEWQIKPDSNIGDALSSRNIRASSDTDYGSRTGTKAIRSGSSTLFLQPSGNKIRDLYYDFGTDSFVAKDLTIVSEHILRDGGGAKQIFYQKEPNSLVWAIRNDGKLAALTLERDQEVYAWHLHELGGADTHVISGAVIPDESSEASVLYLLVSRTIAGITTYFVESLEPLFSGDKSEAYFVDAGLSYHGVPVTSVSGLDHLNEMDVDVVADGVYVGPQVVSGGAVTIEDPAVDIHVGLGYRSLVTLLPPITQTRLGPGISRVQRPVEVSVRVHDTMELNFGPTEEDQSLYSFKTSDTPMNDSADPFTGFAVFNANHSPDREGLITFSLARPYPLTILSTISSVAISDRA